MARKKRGGSRFGCLGVVAALLLVLGGIVLFIALAFIMAYVSLISNLAGGF